MKITDTFKRHKAHRYTISGFVVGGILLLISLVDILMLKGPTFHPMSAYITLVPGLALVLRSRHPPIGAVRGISICVGGAMAGAIPMLLTSTDTQVLWSGLVCGLVGAGLLGVGFSPRPKATKTTVL